MEEHADEQTIGGKTYIMESVGWKLLLLWTSKTNNAAHKMLLHATPIFICWNLWKNRCAVKYGGKTTNISREIYKLQRQLQDVEHNISPYHLASQVDRIVPEI